ncbi:hypothetical protein Vadar_031730 [Vaccinium darrowii]|uniref:Uncharacterized protein n=1 Tax=Vaccinium darrowii TaxID=229202 RepID=A0ACB7XDL0_9ERIC|nr:hypothetical protein Vadar_031730 [Vaccinium darrowii]
MVFLMETKNDERYLVGLQKHLGVDDCFCVNPVGLAGGLCIYWKKGVSVQIIKGDMHMVDSYVSMGQYRCRITFVHAPNSAHDRKSLWQELLSVARMETIDWLIGGDFNAILHPDEKVGGAPRQAWELADFQNFIQDSNLVDLGYVGYPFTWNNKRHGGNNVRVQLDRFLSNPRWRIHHPNAVVKHLMPGGSDHCPLLLDAMIRVEKFKHRFIFDRRWAEYEDCAAIIRQAWSCHVQGSKWYQIQRKIRACRIGLLQWRKQHNINSKYNKENLDAKLQSLFECPNFDHVEYSHTELLLKKALKDEEIYWRDKARNTWLKAGDKNTAFFHAQTLQWRQQNRLMGLEDETGIWRDGEQAVKGIAGAYF